MGDEHTIRLWDASVGKHLSAVRFDDNRHLLLLTVSPDGRRIAAGGRGSHPMFGLIQLLDVEGDTLRPWQPKP